MGVGGGVGWGWGWGGGGVFTSALYGDELQRLEHCGSARRTDECLGVDGVSHPEQLLLIAAAARAEPRKEM